MKIGEFAEICDTKISILRHYDKLGLIVPDYIDTFTGYRYYNVEQIGIFKKITALKKAGFSLKEIKSMLSKINNTQIILNLINKKKAEFMSLISNLENAKMIMLGDENMQKPVCIINEDNSIEFSLTVKNPIIDFRKSYILLEEMANAQDYQRISSFRTYGEPNSDEIEIRIDVIRLTALDPKKRLDTTNITFENDDDVGKWAVIGEYAVKDDFYADIDTIDTIYKDKIKEIYFLPNGEPYWIYRWSKGYLISQTGDGIQCNSYELQEYNSNQYMFVQNKSYYYLRGGQPTVLVLQRLDNKEYSKYDMAKKDNIDMPFVDDKNILGKWNSIYFLHSKQAFEPDRRDDVKSLTIKSIEFFENGKCDSIFADKKISGDEMQTWTKGYVLEKWNSMACAYEIRKIKGIEYLIMEWKSGDYIWGGFDTNYYVFIRE